MRSFTDLPSLINISRAFGCRREDIRRRIAKLYQTALTWRRDTSVHKDLCSPAFRNEQMDLNCKLAGVAYDTANERGPFDVADALRHPFPYLTGSSHTFGDDLMGIGFMTEVC
jgi:hypothetical protein